MEIDEADGLSGPWSGKPGNRSTNSLTLSFIHPSNWLLAQQRLRQSIFPNTLIPNLDRKSPESPLSDQAPDQRRTEVRLRVVPSMFSQLGLNLGKRSWLGEKLLLRAEARSAGPPKREFPCSVLRYPVSAAVVFDGVSAAESNALRITWKAVAFNGPSAISLTDSSAFFRAAISSDVFMTPSECSWQAAVHQETVQACVPSPCRSLAQLRSCKFFVEAFPARAAAFLVVPLISPADRPLLRR